MTTTLATATTFDLAAIMAEGHAIARRFAGNGWTFAQRLAHGLRTAWGTAKMQRHTARLIAAHLEEAAREKAAQAASFAAMATDELRRTLTIMENARDLAANREARSLASIELARRLHPAAFAA